MKSIEVVAAVIQHRGRIFATQRGYGEFKDGWEFPGGKIEPNETPQQALRREIKEELDTDIEVKDLIDTIDYDYPTFHLTMHCFWCTVKSGKLELLEHEDAKWLTKEELQSVDWLPADLELLPKIRETWE
ncbi:(deoxy)nucleoside triphosphate pyrophosphohydrolase [Absicoccus intestinalis]|uniref:8-oxo-dGTP diphosphatase n=1 Tax=Absicoccus intestinalis TaxID=2926319 RepID=A0ABU4WIT1_9FIRM|nr:(deoxy)nucleoside triphosphate pyrophosphohydrolase [Absicoccus sp. CLA-KB-P134]MDX8416452.1 (deoxy)nucleoside triphosphate pyrophosphohydrolase [Absicoccus sp. CLA-KB-P134]